MQPQEFMETPSKRIFHNVPHIARYIKEGDSHHKSMIRNYPVFEYTSIMSSSVKPRSSGV